MAESPTFIFLLLFLLRPLLISSQYEQFIFKGFPKPDNNNITLSGVAEIEKNGLLHLTNDTTRKIGRGFYQFPLHFKNSTTNKPFSFSSCFAFAIVPQVHKYPNLSGHGFAFTISPSPNIKEAFPSQYLGLFNQKTMGNSSNHIFAVEFDTTKDLDFGDIDDNHIGIDINSLHSRTSVSATQDLKSGHVILAWVDYDSARNCVHVSISSSSTKPTSPIISFEVDLSPVLQNLMYVGFSASTGLLTSSQYILGWSFKMNGVAESFDISSLPSLPGSKKNNRGLTIGVSVAAAALVAISLTMSAIFFIRKVRDDDVIEDWELNIGPHRFSYNDLKMATRGFRDKELLGFGGFGRVYKGVLENSKTPIAVKRISHESKQGLKEFISEISSMGRLRHRNLIQLHGWCRRRGDLLLVYEYMPNGSLDKFLFEYSQRVLTWEERFNIIKGVASALLYLHEQWEQIVIHRDVKASNVLLDGELNGRLGDFGLAKLYEHGSNPITTKVVGTLGYLAPELTRTGKATTWSDVFAFGALMLEVVSGRRPVEPKAMPEELILVDWVWDKWQEGKVFEVVDKRLMGVGGYDEEEVVMVVKLGLMCSNNVPMARLSMRQVARCLEREVKVPEEVNAPGAYEGEKSLDGFDDFVQSYPSTSFEKVSEQSGGGDDVEAGGALVPHDS